MNIPDSPSNDGLDRQLSAFYKAELPEPFPAFRFSAVNEQLAMPMSAYSRASRMGDSKRRISLAASVALILASCWYLSDHIATPTGGVTISKGENSAKLPKELQKAKETGKSLMP